MRVVALRKISPSMAPPTLLPCRSRSQDGRRNLHKRSKFEHCQELAVKHQLLIDEPERCSTLTQSLNGCRCRSQIRGLALHTGMRVHDRAELSAHFASRIIPSVALYESLDTPLLSLH
jgi:hypothetical protein